ncbi:hypothetical protein WMF27_09975 [Sorangium sp. So ce281]|uniref:hypothetical protein n=1 Tax=Sorangium sp. So ce281 TaxID=3133293 RepID=UPI003F64597D
MDESISGQAAAGSDGSDRAKLSVPQEGLITAGVDGSLELNCLKSADFRTADTKSANIESYLGVLGALGG